MADTLGLYDAPEPVVPNCWYGDCQQPSEGLYLVDGRLTPLCREHRLICELAMARAQGDRRSARRIASDLRALRRIDAVAAATEKRLRHE